MDQKIKILLCEDQEFVSEGIANALNSEPNFEVLKSVVDAEDIAPTLQNMDVDIVITDIITKNKHNVFGKCLKCSFCKCLFVPIKCKECNTKIILKDRDAMGRIVASKVLSKYSIEDFWSIISDGASFGQMYMPKSHFFSTSGNIIGSVTALFDFSDIYQAINEGDDYKFYVKSKNEDGSVNGNNSSKISSKSRSKNNCS